MAPRKARGDSGPSSNTKDAVRAQSLFPQAQAPSPIVTLPNELLDAIVEALEKDPFTNRQDLMHFAIAARRFVPFVRSRLLQAIVIKDSERIEAVIGWLESMTYERSMIRQLRVTAVNLTTGSNGNLVSQKRLAHLLTLVPHLRRLEISRWSSAKVQAKLRSAFGNLASLDTLAFHARRSVRGRAAALGTILAALPAPQLRFLHLNFRHFGLSDESPVPLPAAFTCRHLRLQAETWGQQASPRPVIQLTDYARIASQITVLDVTSEHVTVAMIEAVAPNLKAMMFDGGLVDGVLDLEPPLLELVSFGSTPHRRLSSNSRNFNAAIATIPLLRRIKTLVLPRTPRLPDELQALLAGHQSLQRAFVSVWAPYLPLNHEDPPTDPLDTLRAILPQAQIIDALAVPTCAHPDLLTLLESGRFVQHRITWY